MKTYGGSGGIAPPFLASALDGGEWSALRLDRFIPGKRAPPVLNVQWAGWAPEPVWTLWSKEKNLLPLPGMEPRSFSP
jgi:hypothetical protein